MIDIKYFIGIDPGIKGSIAVIDDQGNILLHTAVPTIKINKKNQYDLFAIDGLLSMIMNKYEFVEVIIEKAQAMPHQGVVSMFTYGRGYGYWIGLMTAMGISYKEVHPKTWTKLLRCGKEFGGKEGNYKRAQELFPQYKAERKSDQTFCDSLLLAEYGRIYK